MKLVSPFQRGTMCQWTWPGRPAPAMRPKFKPMLKSLGLHGLLQDSAETIDGLNEIKMFLVVEFVQSGLVSQGSDQDVAVVIGITIQYDDAKPGASDDEILPIGLRLVSYLELVLLRRRGRESSFDRLQVARRICVRLPARISALSAPVM